MIRHFIITRGAAPIPWNPHQPAPDLPLECVYFGKVLSQLEEEINSEDLTVYFTFDNDTVPEFGHHVVVILIGEEWGLIPRYSRHVRLVARVMSQYPFLGIRRWWPPNRLMPFLVLKHLRNWILHFLSWLRFHYTPRTWPRPLYKERAILHLPWGSAPLVDVPMVPMSERRSNYLFSGTIAAGNEHGVRRFIPAAKVYTRLTLVDALQRLADRFPGLAGSERVAVHDAGGKAVRLSHKAYAAKLMDSKVCLAPRGSVVDTWRFFEGLKSGCAVITDRLPDEWYYRDAPVIQIDSWQDIEATLLPLLSNEKTLTRMHEASIRYWNEVCGESAVARFLGFVLRQGK